MSFKWSEVLEKLDWTDYWDKISDKIEVEREQYKRFHENYSYNIDYLIEKIENKYNSDEYYKREIKLGREPEEYLYTFLYGVANVYGEQLDENEDFLADSYLYKGYKFKLYNGQGSFIRIEKQQFTETI